MENAMGTLIFCIILIVIGSYFMTIDTKYNGE